MSEVELMKNKATMWNHAVDLFFPNPTLVDELNRIVQQLSDYMNDSSFIIDSLYPYRNSFEIDYEYNCVLQFSINAIDQRTNEKKTMMIQQNSTFEPQTQYENLVYEYFFLPIHECFMEIKNFANENQVSIQQLIWERNLNREWRNAYYVKNPVEKVKKLIKNVEK